MYKLIKIHPATYEMPIQEGMIVPGLLIANDALLASEEIEKPLDQVKNVAYLPGIVGHSIAMPDIHWGYGFPIGGVAAMDAEHGVISPGGVGYDINCGVRLAIVPEQFNNLSEKQKDTLIRTIFKNLPSGVGKEHKETIGLSDKDYDQIARKGARFSIEHGFGYAEDIEHTESRGFIEGADMSCVTSIAKDRGRHQLGTIGSGNHFVEIGVVDKIFLPEIAHQWGVAPGQIYILIHSGSRGFGYQVCQDTLDKFVRAGLGKDLPDKQLIAAPIQSEYGKMYFQAMAAAANYAFNNRQQILHIVRKGFAEVLNIDPAQIKLIYDVCHNIAKFENHKVEGKMRKLCVHRKGATRAFGPGAEELAPIYQKTGQPVLVPGDMGRASHLMVGEGNPLTFCSSCHGAGRAKSRIKSMNDWKARDPEGYMKKQGIKVMAASFKTIAEEMPDAYKDVDTVVAAVQEAGLAKMVARLTPRLVIKG